MAVKNPQLSGGEIIPGEDPAAFYQGEMERRSAYQAGDVFEGTLDAAAEGLASRRTQELTDVMQAEDDIFLDRLRAEDAAIEARTEELTEEFLADAPKVVADNEAVSAFARRQARLKAATEQDLMSESELVLLQGQHLKRAIRMNPRLADRFRQAASVVGGFGLISEEVKYLLDIRKQEMEALQAEDSNDWFTKKAIEQGWGKAYDMFNNPAKFMADAMNNYNLYQEAQQAEDAMKIEGYRGELSTQTFQSTMRKNMGSYSVSLSHQLNTVLAEQYGYTDLKTLHSAALAGTAPISLDGLKLQVELLTNNYISSLASNFGTDVISRVSTATFDSEMAPLRNLGATAKSLVGTDRLAMFLDNWEKSAKFGFINSVPGGAQTYFKMELLSKLPDSLSGKWLSREAGRQIAEALDVMWGADIIGSGKAVDPATGAVNLDVLPDGDLEKALKRVGLTEQQLQDATLHAINTVKNINLESEDAAAQSAYFFVAIQGVNNAAERMARGKPMQRQAIADAYLGLVSETKFVDVAMNQPEDRRTNFRDLFKTVSQRELKAISRDLGNDLTAASEGLVWGVDSPSNTEDPQRVAPPGPFGGSARMVPNEAAMAKSGEIISLQLVGTDGRVGFVLNPPTGALPPGEAAKARTRVEELNRRYSNTLSKFTRAYAHAEAIVSGSGRPDYGTAFEEVRGTLLPDVF